MDHDLAVKSRAVERYALGEMGPEELDAFEEHYFSCEICADDVRAVSIFVDNAKAVLREPAEPWPLRPAEKAPARSRGWFSWLKPQVAVGAMATAFVAVLAVQTGTIHRLRAPQMNAATVLHGETRGSAPEFHRGQPISIVLALEEPVKGDEVTAEIRSDSGAVVETLRAKAPPPDAGLSLYLPEPNLKPGRYVVAVGSTKYPFEVR